MLNFLPFITFDGTKQPGRPSNLFNKAVKKSQQCCLGQLSVKVDIQRKFFSLVVYLNNEIFLEVNNPQGIQINKLDTSYELVISREHIDEGSCKQITKGYQRNLKINICMHFVKYTRYGKLTKADEELYLNAAEKVENSAQEDNDLRKNAFTASEFPELVAESISETTKDKIDDLIQKIEVLKKNLETKIYCFDQNQNKMYPFCPNSVCRCGFCLHAKQKEKNKLIKEASFKKAKEEEIALEKEAEVSKKIKSLEERNKELAENLQRVTEKLEIEEKCRKGGQRLEEQISLLKKEKEEDKILLMKEKQDREQDVSKLQKQLSESRQQLQEQHQQQLQQLKEQHQQRIQQLKQQYEQQLQQSQQPQQSQPQVQVVEHQVYITQTGRCYHTYPSCPGLSRANGVYPANLANVGHLRACMKC